MYSKDPIDQGSTKVHFTLELKGFFFHDVSIMSLVEKAEAVQVHFILDHEDMIAWGPKKFKWMKNMHGVLHGTK